MKSKRLIAIVAASTALLAAAVAGAAPAVPKAGDYQGTVNGTVTTHGHNEGEGYFSVKVINGARKIVSFGAFSKILAPSRFRCHQLNANIQAPRIPITGGAFNYSGTTPIGDIHGANRHIVFKGHWTDRKHLSGSTRVIGPNCDKTVYWKMKTPPPA